MSWKRHVGVLGFFLGLTFLALYWPLFHASTHVGGSWTTDYYHFNWNYWWVSHALTTPGLNIFETNFVLFPFTTNLAYHTLTLFWYPLWALLEPLSGTLVAMAAIQALAMTLTGYFCFLFLRFEKVPHGLALAGAALFQLSPAMLLSVMLSTINYTSLFWIPALLLIWGQLARAVRRAQKDAASARPAILWSITLGLAVYGMMLTDYQHLLFAVFLLVPYSVLTLIEAQGWPTRAQLILLGALGLALAALLLWFAGPLPYILSFDRSSLSPQPIEDAQHIPFPLGFIWRYGTYEFRQITLGPLVLPALLLTLIASLAVLRRRFQDRRRWFWLALAGIPLILTPGAFITLGDAAVALPYTAFHALFGGLFRSPARFAPILIIAVAVFVGRTWGPLLARRARWRLPVGLAALFIVFAEARLDGVMPIQPVTPHYEFYERLGQERGAPYDDYAVVEVPIAGGSGEAWVGDFKPMETQFYGMTHGKRMLNGSIARAPLDHFWYWLYDDPLLAWLGQRRWLEPDRVEPLLRERIFDWPIGYIVIHQDLIGRVGPTNQEIVGYFNALPDLLCPAWVERDAVVYRSAWHPDDCPPRTPPESEPGVYQIDIGSAGDERFIGWGWHWPERIAGISVRWTGEYPQTRLYLDLPPGDYEIEVSAQAFWETRTLRLLANGEPLGAAADVPVEALQTHRFSLPAAVVGDGQHLTLILDYDGWVVPVEVGQSSDERKLALMVDWVRFTKRS